MKTVGILGGMGPEATVLLMQKVLEAVPAADDADHVPLIVHQNPQVPSRIAALIEGTGEDPAPTLRQMARDLKAAGADALAMPCNTAHHYAPALAGEGLPFLDMTEATAARLTGRVGMLASPAVRKTGVFDAAFDARGIAPVWAEEEALLALIRAVKSGGGDRAELRRIAEQLKSAGAERLLVACTELSLMSDGLEGFDWLDSLDALTEEIVTFARG